MADTANNAPAAPAADTPDKQLRQRVDRLLAQPAATSSGQLTLGKRKLAYTTAVEFMPVSAEGLEGVQNEPQGAVMTTAYLAKDADPAQRPVCFTFNGGPGSCSIWLQFGAVGPMRITTPADGSMPAPPYALQDNPQSWLEHFDLVFIDPPHTGWSISASEAARKKHLGVDGDVAALAEAMRCWLTRHRRWGSPVYLAGESYGTTRGAALADKMAEIGVALSGVILISCAMDLQSIAFAPANDLPYALFLPALANVSQYHGLLKGELGASSAAARAAAEAFVDEDYAAALLAGHRLSEKRRSKVAKRISELTGLQQALVEEKNLRISDQTYFFEALRHKGLQVGRLEARVTGPLGANRGREWEFDPGIEAIAAPYTMAAMAYYAQTLGVTSETRYEVLNREVNRSWNWSRGQAFGNGFASTTPDLARALRRNPHLRVFVGSGRYDLGTPYSASDWSLANLDVPADVMSRVQHRYYDAGHMMYTREADLKQLKADLSAWLK